MLESAIKQGKTDQRLLTDYTIVGIDPGETTGFGYTNPWESNPNPHLYLKQLQTKTVEQGYEMLVKHWPNTRIPTIAVCEDYKVYGWKADDHKWAGLHTPQFIGAIKIFCLLRGIPLFFQMAQEAKAWSTDEKLKSWGVYETSMRHARDAERHILNFQFFGGSNSKVQAFLETQKIPLEDQ